MRLAIILAPALIAVPAFAQASQPASAPAAAASAPASSPAAPTGEMGSLSVSSSPAGAKILIDGKDTGKTTPAVDLAVGPGTHELSVVMNGKAKKVTFHLEAGGILSLNLNLPSAGGGEPATGGSSSKPADKDAGTAEVVTGGTDGSIAPPEPVEDWTWMTVAGWSGLGLGTMGIVAGSVVLATQGDPDQGPLGFGLFGAGAGLILGGGVLLYLDEELGREEGGEVAALPLMPLAMPAR